MESLDRRSFITEFWMVLVKKAQYLKKKPTTTWKETISDLQHLNTATKNNAPIHYSLFIYLSFNNMYIFSLPYLLLAQVCLFCDERAF